MIKITVTFFLEFILMFLGAYTLLILFRSTLLNTKSFAMKVLSDNEETGCCKRFNPSPWDEKEINFRDQLFIKDRVRSFFHIPLNYGKVVKINIEKIDKAGIKIKELPLMLTDENSLWGADIYIAVNNNIPNSEIVKIKGDFLSKVFEGSYKNIKKWMIEMENFVNSKGKKMKKLYFYYTTCPTCAKAYGKNYTVLLAKV